MLINNKEIKIEDLTKNINIDMHKKRENGLYLKDEQIQILKKYNINYLKHNNILSLIYEIEELLNEGIIYDDLENLSIELSEYNYYHNTNK